MEVLLITLLSIATLTVSVFYYKAKKSFERIIAENDSNNLYRLQEQQRKYDERITLFKKELNEKYEVKETKLSETLNAEYEKKCETHRNYYKELIERRLAERNDFLKAEYETQLKEAEEQTIKILQEADNNIGERIKAVMAKVTLPFYCNCNPDKPIYTPIDFQEENKYECPECGSLYRINIDAYSTLIDHKISNEKLIDAVNKIYNEQLENKDSNEG